MSTKAVKLRAFSINQTSELSTEDRSLISLLRQVFTPDSIVQDRRMQLNEVEDEEDVLPFFRWNTDKSFVFGMVMRVLKNDITQGIPSDLYDRESFSISDIDGAEGIDTCKSFYYIALNENFLVTNLPGNFPINRVETYINYLVREQRRGIYNFVPVMTVPEGLPLSQIRKIVVGENISLNASTEGIGSSIKTLSKEAIAHLLGENPNITELTERDIIRADLVLKFRKKPSDMSKEDYERLLGQMTHPLSDDTGICIVTKQNKKISGSEIRREKRVTVDTTETGRFNEVNLMQEMELFITELMRE